MKDIEKQIKAYVKADVPVLLWGAPGVGKTSYIEDFFKKENIHLEVLIGSIMDPTDLGTPIPVKEDGVEVRMAPPPWAKRIKKALDEGKEAALFMDELTCAPPSVQAALLRVTQERKVGEVDISGCKMLAAANPTEYAADVNDISAATANRWAHIDWDVDANTWCLGEMSGWGKPDKKLSEVRSIVTSWIDKNPAALLNPPKANTDDIKGWPSPRSWSNVCKTLGNLGKKEIKTKTGRQIMNSLIGGPATTEFIAWIADNDIPSPKELLDGTKKLPTRGDKSMLAMNMTISYAFDNNRFGDLWKLCEKQRKDCKIQSAKKAINLAKKLNIELHKKANAEILQSIVDQYKELKSV